MACILLTDMEPPVSSPPAPPNHLLPAQDPACTPQPKEELSAACLSVHLYHQGKDGPSCGSKGPESALWFPAGQYVAEELCISAAKACGEFRDWLPPLPPGSVQALPPFRTVLESLSDCLEVRIPDVDADKREQKALVTGFGLKLTKLCSSSPVTVADGSSSSSQGGNLHNWFDL